MPLLASFCRAQCPGENPLLANISRKYFHFIQANSQANTDFNHNVFWKWQITFFFDGCVRTDAQWFCVDLTIFLPFSFPCFHETTFNFGTVISAWGLHLQIIWDPVIAFMFSFLLSKLDKAEKCHRVLFSFLFFSFGWFFFFPTLSKKRTQRKRTQINGKEYQSVFAGYLKCSWSGSNYCQWFCITSKKKKKRNFIHFHV